MAWFFLIVLLLWGTGAPGWAAIEPSYQKRLEGLLQRLQERGFSEAELIRSFEDNRVTLYPEILERRGKGLNYRTRQFGLFTKKSVREGRAVLQTHRSLLRKVEAEYGVGREVLVAILRVETNFGRATGRHPVFNSLLTLTLIENRRSAWAEGELEQLLLLAREQDRDPLAIRGSWAGAFGLPQFIPSSYRKYGADGNRDGRIDLENLADSFASIANYLKASGWDPKDPIKKKEAVYAYNHCDNYVQAVLAYARAIKH
ncbi:MAG: lytic murein transglycosylase [Desulfobacterota bacterium]|nr:lytic murein transglycosylase [Thermodesulfobacteriota bacterium]